MAKHEIDVTGLTASGWLFRGNGITSRCIEKEKNICWDKWIWGDLWVNFWIFRRTIKFHKGLNEGVFSSMYNANLEKQVLRGEERYIS